ncbi:MAG: bifunctional oligoribonuclease/PAP phosphatase NrnA [Pseudomonadota bacterium]
MPFQRWDISASRDKIAELASVIGEHKQTKVFVLCHNNPDPDTLASAYGFSYLLQKKFNAKCLIGYGGALTRAENKAMVNRLRIPVNRVDQKDLSAHKCIALIDAQPLTGNNLMMSKSRRPLVVIDHHPLRRASQQALFYDVRPNFGATSTIITEYLVAAELTPPRSVANALFYGIKTDTNSLIRSCTKPDQQAFNYLASISNPRVIGAIEKPPLPLSYFADLQRGLANTIIFRDVACSFIGKVKTDSIIPELADILLRLEGVKWSLCFGQFDEMMAISLRSKSRTQRAGLILRRLVGKTGSAGGHREMAGGQIPMRIMDEEHKTALPSKLIARFLKLLKRENSNSKPLVRND